MSASPTLLEWIVHFLDASYGAACVLFLGVAAWAVIAEVASRRRAHAPLFGPWPPAGGVPSAPAEEVRP